MSRDPLTRRRFLTSLMSMAALAPLAGMGYAVGIEPAWLEVTETDVVLPGLRSDLDGFRIALVTDVHYGGYLPLSRLERVVEQVDALGVDLVALTGDFVSEPRTAAYMLARVRRLPRPNLGCSPNAEELFGICTPRLAAMRGGLGTLAVLGNHDHWVNATVARRSLAEHGIELVENRHRVVERGNARLVVAGAGDLWDGVQDFDAAFAGAPPPDEAPRIVLVHNPDTAMERGPARHGVRLMLCGHTHGGQVYIPGIGAPILPIRYRQFARGLVDAPWGPVYVSRGIGQASPPARLFARPEIAVIRLRTPFLEES